jgi:Acetyltransferase (GNAT) domain
MRGTEMFCWRILTRWSGLTAGRTTAGRASRSRPTAWPSASSPASPRARCWRSWICCGPGLVRRGLARRLIGDLVPTARLAGIARIEVSANPHADGFYRIAGFVVFDQCETRFGPAVRMQLVLSAPAAAASPQTEDRHDLPRERCGKSTSERCRSHRTAVSRPNDYRTLR